MLTERDAIERAWAFVRRKGISVAAGVRSATLETAPPFMDNWASRGEVWSVVFDLDIPPDCVQSPDIAVILVDPETGETAAVELN